MDVLGLVHVKLLYYCSLLQHLCHITHMNKVNLLTWNACMCVFCHGQLFWPAGSMIEQTKTLQHEDFLHHSLHELPSIQLLLKNKVAKTSVTTKTVIASRAAQVK